MNEKTKPKFPPGQATLIASILAGCELRRDGGTFWLKRPDLKPGFQMDPVKSVVVNALIAKRALKLEGRVAGSWHVDWYSLDKTKI